ncbi:MAG: T9SS type A sorting domain-containing protein [Bacteroidales bacterium]|nr:T9SS type A sorting domain-containing protein [Bacteroidales bacterium]
MKTILLSLAMLFALSLSAQTPATIYEIQGQADASPYENQIVITSGLVTSLIRDYGFFLQDGDGPWSGVYVFYDDADFNAGLNLGDEVQITGKVNEYFEKTEITELVLAEVISTGNAVPTPISLSTVNVPEEQYEGVLVSVSNAVVTDTTLGYGEILVNDGSGACRVDDKLYSYWNDMTPYPDSTYQLNGIVDYSYDTYKILPRDAGDFVKGLASIANNNISGLEVYPNPVSNGNVYLNADSRLESVTVFNVIGQAVYSEAELNSTQVSMNLNMLNDGVYILRIETVKGETATRRIMID